MYGVVEYGGHQYRVTAGDLLDVEKITAEPGTTVVLDKVLFIGGEGPIVGLPTVSGAKVTAKVVKHDRGEKIRILKRRPGQYKKTRGHRQWYTALLITQIDNGKGQIANIDPESKTAKKFLAK
jgi:large subunit ribosomal protein L21